MTLTDTVITSIKEKASVCSGRHCTGSQGCPLCQVWQQRLLHQSKHTSGWSSSISTLCPSAGRRVSRTSQLFEPLAADSEETLDADSGLEINSEPHGSYLRGIWQLKKNNGVSMLLTASRRVREYVTLEIVPSPVTFFRFLSLLFLPSSSSLPFPTRGTTLPIHLFSLSDGRLIYWCNSNIIIFLPYNIRNSFPDSEKQRNKLVNCKYMSTVSPRNYIYVFIQICFVVNVTTV